MLVVSGYFKNVDEFATGFARWVIRFRWGVIACAVILAAGVGAGILKLEFANNYRVFFSPDNPELRAFEHVQETYTKNDNFLFVLEPDDGTVFSNKTLTAITALTDSAWKIPFAIRVDSLTNFQSTTGVDDDLIVEDLVNNAESASSSELESKLQIALDEPLLLNQLITPKANATAVNVILQYPGERLAEVFEAAAAAREVRDSIEAEYPHLEISLTGVSMLNNAFSEAAIRDISSVIPVMFGIILIMTVLILRSISGTFVTLVIIVLSTTVGMGVAGFTGVELTPVSGSAPIVILTLAIADSIHILVSFRAALREGLAKGAAIVEAMRLNFLPVTITSITTIVGFLALNFSDSPPFWHLGNITAAGIAAAWLYSITVLPAMVSLLPFKVKVSHRRSWSHRLMVRIADFAISQRNKLLIGLGAASIVLIAFIPSIQYNTQWVDYFDESIEFRTDSDRALKHFGMYPIEFSVGASGPGAVSEPFYLEKLEQFAEFLRNHPEVMHVYSISDVMKRLNKNLHGDDPAYYRIPDNRELSAQYLLLYEMSLPYGLDMNDRINIDKSASRVTATLHNSTTMQAKKFLQDTAAWGKQNLPEYMHAKPTSAQVMFTYITERNVSNMIRGTIVAILAIALIMVIALRSWPLGLLSLVPNGLPILATFGAWALLVGEVGFSVAIVGSISLGIVVDDTVHFLSKYVRARREKGLDSADSIRYAFTSVGTAIMVSTLILASGFLVLVTSSFKVNADLGLLTALAIIFALILDFLFLPALLLLGGEKLVVGSARKIPQPEAS